MARNRVARNRVKTAVPYFFIVALTIMGAQSAWAAPDVNISEIALNGDPVGNEAEMMIDVNPFNPEHWVVLCHGNVVDPEGDGWSDDYPEVVNLFWTLDAGATWHRQPIGFEEDHYNFATAKPDARADPTIAFADDDAGSLYIGYIVVDDYEREDGNRHIVIARATFNEIDNKYDFESFSIARQNKNLDKIHLATGPDPENPSTHAVYVAWNEDDPMVAYSTDLGITWTPRAIDTGVSSNHFVDPAVGVNGELYLVWYGGGKLNWAVSTDRGDNFDVYEDFADPHFFVQTIPAAPMRGSFVGPVLDVDRSGGDFDGRVYLTWCDYESSANENDTNIYFQYYDPNDIVPDWSAPIQINHDGDSGTSQFLPWLDVNQDTGTVALAWYDARDDTAFNEEVHVYVNYSVDGGVTFQSDDAQLSDIASDESEEFIPGDGGTWARDYLEYIGVVAYGTGDDESVRAIWAGDPDYVGDPLPENYDLDIYTDWIAVDPETIECTTDDECDDENPCTEDVCDEGTHTCEHTPLNIVYEAENDMASTVGNGYPEGWNLHSNGSLYFWHTFAGGTENMTVRAAGSQAGGQWPQMRIDVNGSTVAWFWVTNESWQDYSFTFDVPAGTYEVTISFVNDYYNPPEDRNLYVDKAVLDCNDGSIPPGDAINLGPVNSTTYYSLNGSQNLVIDQFDELADWYPPATRVIVGFADQSGGLLNGISVTVDGGTTYSLWDYWYTIEIPYTSQSEINLSVNGGSPGQNIRTYWWAQP